MEKITRQAFEELLEKDEVLQAKAKEFIGDGSAEKAVAFAASLGYELNLTGNTREISPNEMENVAGGAPQDQSMSPAKQKRVECKKKGHDWAFVKREKGILWGYNSYYRCNRCGAERKDWD